MTSSMEDITQYMVENGHSELICLADAGTGLRAIIAIHDTTVGPAMGPPRMAVFSSDREAIVQALIFSKAQTYKYALLGIPFCGGRCLVLADPSVHKSEAMVRSLGQRIESLGGRYVLTGGGGGFTDHDMAVLKSETDHIVGLPESLGGSGEPAGFTAYGVFLGMKSCAEKVFGAASLQGKTVAMQGFGRVGSSLGTLLLGAGARLVVADIEEDTLVKARSIGAETVEPDAIYDTPCDIFSPCGWSGTLNSSTIPRLRCRIVAGPANNQFSDESRGPGELRARGILHAPEYVIGAGGIINMASEIGGYDPDAARARIERIPLTLQEVFAVAENKDTTTMGAADILAEERIQLARKEGRHGRLP